MVKILSLVRIKSLLKVRCRKERPVGSGETCKANKADGDSDIVVVEGATHIKAYDDPAYIDQAVQAIDGFYRKHLG